MKRAFIKPLAILLALLLCGCYGKAAPADTYEETAAVISAGLELSDEAEPLVISCRVDTGKLLRSDMSDIFSEGAYMVELTTDTVVAEKEPDKRLIPASLTKIMTALVCLENIDDLDTPVECADACFDDFERSENPNFDNASGAGIEAGQTGLTYRDCLYALMLPSGCEAANVIAYNVAGGDIRKFVDMMNETAEKIGCENSHFTNAHGLYEEENYSSAKDMCLITRYAMENFPEFTEISCATWYMMPPNGENPDGYEIKHTNRMCRTDGNEYSYEGVKGIKTGSINEYFSYNEETGEWDKVECAGVRGLVALYENNGYRYLLSTVESAFYLEDGTLPEKQYPYLDHKALFDYAKEELSEKTVISKGDVIMTIGVIGGENDTVDIIADGELSLLLPNSAEAADALRFTYPSAPEPLRAPVKAGDEVGTLVIGRNGVTTEIPLVTKEAVSLAEYEAA